MTQDVWLAKHPYLRPVADLHALIGSIVDEITVPSADIPAWQDYLPDFIAGIPLLRSSRVRIDFCPAERTIVALARKFASKSLPRALRKQSQALASELYENQDSQAHLLTWLVDKDSCATCQPGLLHYLSWAVLRHYLSRVSAAFGNWRDEERWLHNYCPMCGSLPAMAQLVGSDPVRIRFLSCGCCATRWRYRRTECPFCEKDEHRQAILSLEASPLRIDYCEACGGYLKTYNGEGSENLLLADWSSLHLDVLACDRGLRRFARSLYQF